jgi:hypothetical protein
MAVIELLFIHLLLVCINCLSYVTSSDSYRTLYSNAVTSYNQQRWFECAALMNAAIDDRRSYLRGVSECRWQCRAAGYMSDFQPDKLEDDEYLNAAAKHSDCIEECKLVKFSGRYDSPVDSAVEEAFDRRIPYDYLQLCAYKVICTLESVVGHVAGDEFRFSVRVSYIIDVTHVVAIGSKA